MAHLHAFTRALTIAAFCGLLAPGSHAEWRLGILPQHTTAVALNDVGQLLGDKAPYGEECPHPRCFFRGSTFLYSHSTGYQPQEGQYATGLNNHGQMTGFNMPPFAIPSGFVTSAGPYTAPPYQLGTTVLVNNRGDVVATSEEAPGISLYLHGQAPVSIYQGVGGPAAINDAGQVLLMQYEHGISSLLYTNGQLTPLGTLGGTSLTGSLLNEAGQVAGTVAFADRTRQHAFLYDAGVVRDLGTLGGTRSSAGGLNDLGQVVGNSTLASGKTHAFLYANGQMTDLGLMFGELDSYALAINNAGSILLLTRDSANGAEGYFLYRKGQLLDFAALVPELLAAGKPSGLMLSEADDIAGTITLADRSTKAFLMSPVPEAGSGLMVVAGLGVLGLAGVGKGRRGKGLRRQPA